MAMTLRDLLRDVAAVHLRTLRDPAVISAQTQRAALVDLMALIRQEIDDLVLAQLVKFSGIRVLHAADMSSEVDDRNLHAQADAQIRKIVRPAVSGGQDFALDPAIAEAARNDHAVALRQDVFHRLLVDALGVDPHNLDIGTVGIARMPQCLGHRKIRVVQLDVLPDQPDGHTALRAVDLVDQRFPVREIRRRCFDTELSAYDVREMMRFQHQRCFIQYRDGDVFDDTIRLDIAEQRDLPENTFFQLFVSSEDDDVRLDAESLQILDRVLCRLALVLI